VRVRVREKEKKKREERKKESEIEKKEKREERKYIILIFHPCYSVVLYGHTYCSEHVKKFGFSYPT